MNKAKHVVQSSLSVKKTCFASTTENMLFFLTDNGECVTCFALLIFSTMESEPAVPGASCPVMITPSTLIIAIRSSASSVYVSSRVDKYSSYEIPCIFFVKTDSTSALSEFPTVKVKSVFF